MQIEENVARLTAENRSSMLQDLDRGRRTEINEINGVVVDLGEKYGVKCEVNEALLHLGWGYGRSKKIARVFLPIWRLKNCAFKNFLNECIL